MLIIDAAMNAVCSVADIRVYFLYPREDIFRGRANCKTPPLTEISDADPHDRAHRQRWRDDRGRLAPGDRLRER